MAVRRRRTASAVYVDGNTVRKSEWIQAKQLPEDEIQQEYRRSHRVRRNQERALYMDGPYVFVLTIAALVTLLLCVNYLHVQASITARMDHIEELELKLEHLKSENDALQTRIDTYIDLEYVYKVATEDLGMVYANKEQVLLYNKTESEYVRQYEDIPKH